ncbi:MAG: hypothetical protein WKG01_27835 [Kofleriaceae bacterium]
MTRHSESGSAILIVLVVMVALLGGGAALVSTQLKATRSTDLTRTSAAALHCAEAGLAAAREVVAANYGGWTAALGQSTEPTWLAAVSHDVDGDGVKDFTISLRDNDDEQAPLANNTALDNDLAIYVTATCIKYPEIQKQVSELVLYNGAGGCYESQLGGCGGNGNSN